MADGPTPEEVEEARAACGRLVAFTADHFDQMVSTTAFTREECWELTLQYHWAMLTGALSDDD